jgi:hypothetical protein
MVEHREIDFGWDPEDWDSDDEYAHTYYSKIEEGDPEAMTKYILRDNQFRRHPVNKGDIVTLSHKPDVLFLWDGEKIVNLYTNLVRYGGVPPHIEITDDNDLTPYSWCLSEVKIRSRYVWYSPEIRYRMQFNEQKEAEVTICGKKWRFKYYGTASLDKLHDAIRNNRCIFSGSEHPTAEYDSANICYNVDVEISDETHGEVRAPDYKQIKRIITAEMKALKEDRKKISDKIASLKALKASCTCTHKSN